MYVESTIKKHLWNNAFNFIPSIFLDMYIYKINTLKYEQGDREMGEWHALYHTYMCVLSALFGSFTMINKYAWKE